MNPQITRRELLGGLTATVVLGRGAGAVEAPPVPVAASPYRLAADGAARWLAHHAIPTRRGVSWAADPQDPTSVQTSLYSGTPGVLLFLLEYAAVTGDPEMRALARRGVQELVARVDSAPPDASSGEGAGLYTGLAGVIFTLERAATLTGDGAAREAAQRTMDVLVRRANRQNGRASWNESTDIISGTAGIGLTMLWAHKSLRTPGAVTLATEAGRALIEAGARAPGGLTWAINPKMPRRYPNFSHGAGGIGFFLASLYGATGEQAFLDGALEAARYLQSVATTTASGGRMVFHSEPGNEQLFYLSWCHGPSGTSRLFHRLAEVTRDRAWSTYADQLNIATRDMKVPERSPGFWNNVSSCCGNCGVVEHLVALHDRGGDTRALDYAERIADDVIARGTPDGDGMKWVQAEHRTQPTLLVAQTGLMQGAAGVGLAMLHLDGARSKRRPLVILPDSPYFA